jgi:peroxiredoxin
MNIEDVLRKRSCHNGHNIADLTHELPVLFIFLRHLGCTFCRETLHELAAQRRDIELEGAAIALVHMSPAEEAEEIFNKYQLNNVIRIEDTEQELYRAFHLSRGSLRRLFGIKVWVRGFIAGVLRGHGLGPRMGDVAQMPGVFLVYNGEVVREFRHISPADRPDYVSMASYPFELEKVH